MLRTEGNIKSLKDIEQSVIDRLSIQQDESKQYLVFFRYGSIGGFATALHYVVLAILVERFYLTPWLAASSGAACGALISYVGNHRFTFGRRARHHIALPRFLLIAAFGTALNGAIVWLEIEFLSYHYLVAQIGATLCVLLITYRLNRTWTFI